jgi:hypothetical protein
MSEPMFLTFNEVVDRDRGEPLGSAPPTPPYVRSVYGGSRGCANTLLGKTVRYRLGSSIAGIAEISSSVGPSEHP